MLPAGVYQLDFGWIITGAVETAALNVRLQYNGSGKIDLNSGGGVANYSTGTVPRATLDGSNVVKLNTIAGATGRTVFSGLSSR